MVATGALPTLITVVGIVSTLSVVWIVVVVLILFYFYWLLLLENIMIVFLNYQLGDH
jgi:hypothetical protein